MKRIVSVVLAGSVLMSLQTQAEAPQMPAAAATCMACHGANGEGQSAANFPRLAGLPKSYLHAQLTSFTDGSRQNPIMAGMAAVLSDADKDAVADYFSRLNPPKSPVPAVTDMALLEAGRVLAVDGDWDNTIPACFSCHGPNGLGVGDNFPALAGQSAGYISGQLTAWRQGLRNNDPDALMKTVALRLNDEQIKAVSAYLSSLPVSAK